MPNKAITRTRPRHPRAESTVQRILASAADLLAEHFISEVTSQDLADRSFVSIGTLYRYFPSKESIYLRLYESTVSHGAVVMRDVQLGNAGLPYERSLRPILAAMLDLYLREKQVLIRLPEQAPKLFEPSRLMTVDQLVEQASRTYLRSVLLTYQGRATDEGIVYFMLRNAMLENIRRFVIEARPDLERERFLDELSRLAWCYLESHT